MYNKLAKKIARLYLKKSSELQSHSIMDEYDYNHDGLVGRDEWGGSEDVFSLLDTDQDEYLSPSEISQGLGNSFSRSARKRKFAQEEEYLTPEEIAKIMGGTIISVKPMK
jgi:hypothetical protein